MSLQERWLRKEAFDHLLARLITLKSENSAKCLRLFGVSESLESEHNGKKAIRLYQAAGVLPACYSEVKSCLPPCKPLGFGDRNVTNLVNVLSIVIIKWLCQLANPWIRVQAPVTWWERIPWSRRQSPSLHCSFYNVKLCLCLMPCSEVEGVEKAALL